MRTTFLAALALSAALAAPGLARADQVGDQGAAVQLCRSQITSQAGVTDDQLRLTQATTRLSGIRVHFDLWRNGQVQGVDCQVLRHDGAFQVAAINPPLVATAASAQSGH